MLIVYRRMNGMCNQFQTLAHQIATLLDGNISGKIISLRFEYKMVFPNLQTDKRIKLYNSRFVERMVTFGYIITRNILRNCELFLDYHCYTEQANELEKRIYTKGFKYINAFSGWPYYAQKAFIKYRDKIRYCFKLDLQLEPIIEKNKWIEKSLTYVLEYMYVEAITKSFRMESFTILIFNILNVVKV